MATFVMTEVTSWAHGVDLTDVTNKVKVSAEAETRDATTFGSSGYRERRGGLKNVSLDFAGFWEGDVDNVTFPDLGTADRPVTISSTGTVGDVAYLCNAGRTSYEQFDAVGEMTPFSLQMMGSHRYGLVRGRVVRARGDVSATGGGTAVEVGAGAAGYYVYAAVHVFDAGTTITVQVQSDNAEAFTTPTTVGTIGPLTTEGGAFLTRVDASAITDTWWRLNVSAITGTFNVAGAIAVQP